MVLWSQDINHFIEKHKKLMAQMINNDANFTENELYKRYTERKGGKKRKTKRRKRRRKQTRRRC